MHRLAAFLTSGLFALLCLPCQAAPVVVARLTDGSRLEAEIDSRTDQAQLWLRVESATTLLLRPISWQRVTSVSFEGQAQSRQQILNLAARKRGKEHPKRRVLNRNGLTYAERSARALAGPDRLGVVRFTASTADWDKIPGADGLVIRVYAADDDGRSVAVDGRLVVQLFDTAQRLTTVGHPDGGPALVGRWTNRIEKIDFTRDGIELRLPFDDDFNGADAGDVVQLRLITTGYGTFGQDVAIAHE